MFEALDGLGWNMTVTTFARLYWAGWSVLTVVIAGAATVAFRFAQAAVPVASDPVVLLALFVVANLYTLGVSMARDTFTRRADIVSAPTGRDLFVAVDHSALALFLAVVVRPALQQTALVLLLCLGFVQVFAAPLASVVSRPEVLLGLPLLCFLVRIGLAGFLAGRVGTGRIPVLVTTAVLVPAGFLGARQLASLTPGLPGPSRSTDWWPPVTTTMVTVTGAAATLAVILPMVVAATGRLHARGLRVRETAHAAPVSAAPGPSRGGRHGPLFPLRSHLRALTHGRPGQLAVRTAFAATAVTAMVAGTATAVDPESAMGQLSRSWAAHGLTVVTFLMALAAGEVVVAVVGVNSLLRHLRWGWELGNRSWAGLMPITLTAAMAGLLTGCATAMAAMPLLGAEVLPAIGLAAAVTLAALFADALTASPERPDGTTAPSLGAGFLTVFLSLPLLGVALMSPRWAGPVTVAVALVLAGGVIACGSRRVLSMQLSA